MNLLEFGMKYEKSSSKMQRLVAKCALDMEKRKANRYEAYLNRTQAEVPEDPGKTAALLQSIREQIVQCRLGAEEEE